MKRVNKKGFTLIELLAVIVILGVLMLVAIPAVTRYIEKSRRQAFISSVNSLVDSVKYGVISGDSAYSMEGATERKFNFNSIETEKGKINIHGYIKVVKKSNEDGYEYKVYSSGSSDGSRSYCVNEMNFENLKIDDIEKCDGIDYEYTVGDEITYNGSTWYVIKNSKYVKDDPSDDYVVLLKQNILTKEELTSNYSYNSTDRMIYYWSSTCHRDGTHGTVTYDQIDTSGCGGHTDYAGSKVKKMLEETYLPTINSSNLKEVDGYKIRLITKDELQENFGYSTVLQCNSSGGNCHFFSKWDFSKFYI